MFLKYVRVLHLDIGFRGKDVLDLTGISSLYLLRYLKLFGNMKVELPSQIGKLQQLETLDLGGSDSKLPSDIANLPLLLHLIVSERTVFPDGIGRLRLVRTLGNFDLGKNSVENIEGLGEMTNLRDFWFHWSGEDLVEGARRMDVLRSSLERISGSLRVLTGLGREDLDGWSTFSPPPIHLRRMWMSGWTFPTIPKWFGHLRDLQDLCFVVREAGLKDDGVAILAGLPSLVFLDLSSREPLEERVHIPGTGSGVAFPALRVFRLTCEHPLLTFEAGSMPMLKKLYLWLRPSSGESVGSVEGPPVDGIEHLPAGLRKIELGIYGGRDEDEDALKSSLKIAFKKHHPSAALVTSSNLLHCHFVHPHVFV
jgi:disease resistance protein RPM1